MVVVVLGVCDGTVVVMFLFGCNTMIALYID